MCKEVDVAESEILTWCSSRGTEETRECSQCPKPGRHEHEGEARSLLLCCCSAADFVISARTKLCTALLLTATFNTEIQNNGIFNKLVFKPRVRPLMFCMSR